jgi:cation:H+ antiporter
MVIALTLVAVGTSVPEYVTTVTAALKGHTDLGLGNIVGANVLNILWALGASGVIHPLTVGPEVRWLDLGAMLGFMALLLLFGTTGGRYERWEGVLLLGLYAGYIASRVLAA